MDIRVNCQDQEAQRIQDLRVVKLQLQKDYQNMVELKECNFLSIKSQEQ